MSDSSIKSHSFQTGSSNFTIKQTEGEVDVNGTKIPHGYVNVSNMCRVNGSRFPNYLAMPETLDYFIEIVNAEADTESGSSIQTRHTQESQTAKTFGIESGLLIQTKDAIGGDGEVYAHIEIALDVAKWVSPKLRLWCNKTILLVMRGEFIAATLAAVEAQDQLQIISKRLLTDTRIDMTNAFKKYYEAKGCTEQEIGRNIAILTNRIYFFLFHENTKELRIKFKTNGSIRPYLKEYENNMVYDIENHAMTLVLNQNYSPDDAITAAFKFYAQYEYFTMQRCPFDLALWEELKSNCGIIEKN